MKLIAIKISKVPMCSNDVIDGQFHIQISFEPKLYRREERQTAVVAEGGGHAKFLLLVNLMGFRNANLICSNKP